MREHKFRGMGVNGEWHYGLLAHTESRKVCNELGWFISNRIGMPFAFRVRPETIGEFTGLHDKNGKEIYEDDILQWKYTTINEKEVTEIGVVRWDKGAFKVYGMNINNQCGWLGEAWLKEFEIIGNIWENPELLQPREAPDAKA